MSDKVMTALSQLATAVSSASARNTCIGVNCSGTWGWSSPYINNVISSPAPARPIRFIVDTNGSPDHVGGNEKLAATGRFQRGSEFSGAVASVGNKASIIAHENVLNRMNGATGKGPAAPQGALPTDTYFDEFTKLPSYFNGEAVIV